MTRLIEGKGKGKGRLSLARCARLSRELEHLLAHLALREHLDLAHALARDAEARAEHAEGLRVVGEQPALDDLAQASSSGS